MALSYLIGRRNAQNTPWTLERDATLIEMWAAGFSASQIANKFRHLDISRCAVIGRAHRLNLSPRKPRNAAVPKPPPPRPQPPLAPPPAVNANAPGVRRLSFTELEPSSCRFPIEEVGFFCGADAESGRVYCPFHQRISRVRA
jgi:hypothetical protein